ncbi:hypothetical protein MJI20_28895, partial [Salmonella enterica subsp. enterica serovar Anatum]|nr:hypothetical protein [Salmonella enterica subsp. enterica serovar Anatum]
ESNQDDAYDRNFLRLRALPLLQQRWPHFPAAVARSATLCAEQGAGGAIMRALISFFFLIIIVSNVETASAETGLLHWTRADRAIP